MSIDNSSFVEIAVRKWGSAALARAIIIVNMPDFDGVGQPYLGEKDIEQLAVLFLEIQRDMADLKKKLHECQEAFENGRETERAAGYGRLEY